MADEGGVWRTISGRKVFIRTGQSLSNAMKESGKFPEKKANEEHDGFSASDMVEAKRLVKDVIGEMEYESYGIRAQEEDTEKIGEIMTHTSKNFGGDLEGSEEEFEDLNGVCAISSAGTIKYDGEYPGKVLYLLGANSVEAGYDPGEIVMKDPAVLAKFAYRDGKIELIEKVDVGEDVKMEDTSVSTKGTSNPYSGTKGQVAEYVSFKFKMESQYGADAMWREMSDKEYETMERLERAAYKGA